MEKKQELRVNCTSWGNACGACICMQMQKYEGGGIQSLISMTLPNVIGIKRHEQARPKKVEILSKRGRIVTVSALALWAN